MALPERVRVKVMSEAAEYISTAPVVTREMPLGDLLEAVVALAGKNTQRLRQLLRAGGMLLDNYRYRWAPLEAEETDLAPLLARFPDPMPGRAFEAQRCVHAVLAGGGATVELPREQAARRRFLKKESFWDVLMEVAGARGPRYHTYSYRRRADVYHLEPAPQDEGRLREAASLLDLGRVADRIRSLPLEKITLLVNR